MSITPGYKSKRRFLQMALKRPEDTKGSDYILNGATPSAIQTKGLSVEPWITETISRDLDDGKNGGQPIIHTGEMIKISGSVEITGSGSVNTPVAFAPVIAMGGYDSVTDVATEVSHNRVLNAANELDGCCYFHWEGMYHILLAGKATLTTSAKIGELAYLNFEMSGIYGGTVSGAIPAGDFSAYQMPVDVSQANTSFSLDGQLFNAVEFEMAQNNTIEYDEGTELKQIFIDDWAPEGKVIIEAPTLDTFDPFAVARSNVLLPYEFTHGTATANIFKQVSTGVQIISVAPGEYKGKQTWELGLREIRGNDSKLVTQ
ncbi:MAG: hypothetical protein CL578_14560 [Alteromonadaceae bacterium]|uniref:hypothetical protein n=1 Tax=Paraglaciecola chathamensis TaxID=368405 RepID=UPI000C5C2108|nr:hypothetical protein [Paraglaciecola agarilytica]MBN26260.1 hypothetical protein [Alteromonadaceae bacterium]|tara:strand:- start:89931 stop:90878 length:948 start_codon:yes stop_codon:yes gene_type:complete